MLQSPGFTLLNVTELFSHRSTALLLVITFINSLFLAATIYVFEFDGVAEIGNYSYGKHHCWKVSIDSFQLIIASSCANCS